MGDLLISLVATIAIFVILISFALGAGLVKMLSSNEAGFSIHSEKNVDIGNIFNYMKSYENLVMIKFLVAKGNSLENAIAEAKYEK